MTSSLVGALPSATARLRRQPSKPGRLSALPRVLSDHSLSLHLNRSQSLTLSRPCLGLKSSSVVSRAYRFHGQTSWQSSQPKMRLPIGRRSGSGIGPLSSIVRYEMQRLASSSNGATIAPVGHASRHARHEPQ